MGEIGCEFFAAGDVTLENGEILNDTRLGYATFGALNRAADNAIVMPTHFGGTHEHSQYLIGSGRALDPDRYFIVIPNLLGNGVSTSPSHGLGADFPRVTIADNINLQYRLLTEALGVKALALAVGHSMGGVQAYHWAMMYPQFVQRAAPICGAARISTHNWVFLEGMRGSLQADPAWAEGRYKSQPIKGLATMARAWGAWPPSSHFYRNRFYEGLGFSSAEDFLTRYWEAFYTAMDANNVLAQIATWQSADISRVAHFDGDFGNALASIEIPVTVMPSRTDAYFPPEDSENETALMPNATLAVIESEWGHWAGSGRNPADTDFIDTQLKNLLADNT